MAPIDDLAQALNQREVTDDEGQVMEENDTPLEDSPTSDEKNTVNEDAPVEKPAKSEDEDTLSESDEDEIDKVELASDETGKRYVPETRFDKVYGKLKGTERENEQLKQRIQALESQGFTPKQAKDIATKPIDKTDLIETELLRATLPQFNPDSPDYSRELDEDAYDIWRNPDNKGMTKLEAGRRAIERAKKLAGKAIKVTEEARTVKAQQSDQGITSRVTSRGVNEETPGEDASPEEIEKWLKAKGQW